jgi:Icc protein
MQIIQISDCHLFADINKVGYNQINPYLSLKNVLQVASNHIPDLLLVTGDLSSDTSLESYRHFNALLAETRLTCDMSILPGNHDHPDTLQAEFAATQLWSNSPLDACDAKWQIHLVNTHHQGTLGYISGHDLAALSNKLQQQPDKYHLIATHHHPVDCGGWMDKHEWVNRREFIDLIECYPTVKAVVYGHIHSDIDTSINNIRYLACPSTCWQWDATDSFSVSELMPGYRVINLLENGQIATSVNRLTNKKDLI